MTTEATVDVLVSDSDEEEEEDEGSQWFDNIQDIQLTGQTPESCIMQSDSDDISSEVTDEDSFFFSDDEDGDPELYLTRTMSDVPGVNKIAQLGADVAHTKQQLNIVYSKVEECDKMVDNAREEVNECRERQKALGREMQVTGEEIRAAAGNIPSVQRLTNLMRRLEDEVKAEKELEEELRMFVRTQELALNEARHVKGQYQHLEVSLTDKEKTLNDIKSSLVLERRKRERQILLNAEKKSINTELEESLVNLEHEERTKQAIAAARQAQKAGHKFLKETWKRVKDREIKEEEEKKIEGERRVKMLLQYKQNLHKTQNKLKNASQRKKRVLKERAVMEQSISAEERYQTAQQQAESEKKAQFHQTQRQAKSALVNKILKEEKALEKRKEQHPQLFNDRLKGRHNKPTRQKYKHILDLAKPKPLKELEPLLERERQIEKTVGYSDSSEDEAEENKEKVVSLHSTEVDDELAEPEFRGLWEAAPPMKITPPSKFSKLEQAKMEQVLQKQKDNIVQKQITVQREFKGQAFMSKPEEVIFSDYEVGETYTQHLTLTNVSYTINTLKLIGLSTNLLDFITVEFSPPGHLSAGLTCEMRVTFTPLINKDITGEIKMLAQTGAFSIPVMCRIKRTEISVPNSKMDFGAVCIGEHQKCFITIVNKGALGTRFKVLPAGWVNTSRAQTEPKEEERLYSANVEEIKRPVIEGLEDKSTAVESISNIQGPSSKLTSSVTFSLRGGDTTLGVPTSDPGTTQGAPTPDPSTMMEESPEESPLPTLLQEQKADEVDEVFEEADITLNKEYTSGRIEPHSTVQIEVLYNPRVVGQHTNCFVVTVQDNSISPATVTITANTIDLPIYVQEQTMYLKHCMVDRLYQDSVVLHNRATSALRIKFEVPRALKDHVDILPQNGVVQANSSFSAQLKFIPLSTIFESCKKYFTDGQFLTIPVNIRVADQTRSVPFTITAHVTGTDISFSTTELDFGCCSIYESVRVEFSMHNHCLLPQMFGFVSLPDFVTIQPNDGFGTLLPGETLHLEAVVHAKVLGDHNFNIVCTTEIDRHFSLKCKATGVIPHLEVSQSLITFAPTALGDVRQASFYIRGESKGEPSPRSFHIVVPDGVDLIVSPSVGTLLPGQRVRVQLTFGPTLKKEDIEREAFATAKKRIESDLERKKKDEEDADKQDISVATNKKAKSRKGQSKPITPKSPLTVPEQDPGDLVVVTEENKIAAMVKLKTQFEKRFDKVLLPCFTAIGECSPDSPLSYNLHDTVYLQVHMPAVRPELLLLSQNGSSVVDFGNVCIGQCEKLELTLKSITDEPLSLSCSAFPHDGTFQKINATRDLEPYGLHQMLLEFNPKSTAKYYEVVEVRTGRSTLHLHLHGRGVEPKLGVEPSVGALDLGHVMVGEVLNGTFTLTNQSEIGLQYKISLLSEKRSVVQNIAGTNDIGNSNKSGILPFSCLPHTGSIEKGMSQEITVKFKPDHQDCFKDVVIVTLLNQHQESRVPLLAQAWSGSMYFIGGHTQSTLVNLHTIIPCNPEQVALVEEDEITGQIWIIFICSMSSPKQLFTETLVIGNIRGLGNKPDALAASSKDKAKPTGDFIIDPIKADYGALVKALVVTPPKGSVEVGNPMEVSFQFTPPKELSELDSTIEFHTMLSLKGEIIEQFKLNFVAKIVA